MRLKFLLRDRRKCFSMSNIGKKMLFFFRIPYNLFLIYLLFIWLPLEANITFLKDVLTFFMKSKGLFCILTDFWLIIAIHLLLISLMYLFGIILLKKFSEDIKDFFRKRNGIYKENLKFK